MASARNLIVLFGALAFLQGLIEPTEGLASQPARSLWKGWGHGASGIAGFAAILAAPWWLKPLYGWLSDSVPLAGSRRRGYLVVSGLVAAGGYALLLSGGDTLGPWTLLAGLLIPTAAMAMGDVAADALMIEVGRPRGLVGRLQASQWACAYASALLAGSLGGRLAIPGRQGVVLVAGALLAIVLVAITLAFVHEPPASEVARGVAWRDIRTPGLVRIAAFLFLWNFNPFSQATLYLHLTQGLGLSEPEAGDLSTAFAAACLVASVLYVWVSRRWSIRALVAASIPLGVLSQLIYWGLGEGRLALPITIVAGLMYQTATLAQLELAARSCPPAVAGTLFASLMALENVAASLATGLGGVFYERWEMSWGDQAAFNALVGISAGFTAACCWILPRVLVTLPTNDSAGNEGVSVQKP